MLTYGSEVWGLIADNRTIQRIHLFAIKRLLNVSPKRRMRLFMEKRVDTQCIFPHTRDALNIG